METMPSPERPLATLFVMAYRQERFIAEAVEGAFSQTYSPLEIILSDDCSPDGTFAVMQEMAAAYQGPHQVRLNRNPVNLGLIGHLERIMEMARGEIVVQNAGDDISEPVRTQRLVDVWLANDRKPRLVHSRASVIDEAGRPLGLRRVDPRLMADPAPLDVIRYNLTGTGAMYAWTPDLFERFGGLGEALIVEDFCVTFRAACLGGIAFVDEPLVRKRAGGLSVTKRNMDGPEYLYGGPLKHHRWNAANRRQCLQDLQRLDPPQAQECREECLRQLERMELIISLAEGSRLRRLMSLPRALRIDLREGRPHALKSLVKYLFDFAYMPYRNLRNRGRENPPDHLLIEPSHLGEGRS